ncbi:fatty acyl-CoA reductase 1-like [Amphiura filiformis]|uniref:fatty acyl-CoA reductase 1-like n=1 Tax=Amphiura filiformis TaxID=82378 RepID=UPI003B21B04A
MLCDLFVKMMGKRARMLKTYDHMMTSMYLLKYFTCNEWAWSHSNYEKLLETIPETDRKEFFMDARPLDWREYLQTYVRGIKQFVLKEDSGATRRQLIRMRMLRWLINTVIITALCRLLLSNSQMARNIWYLILHTVFQVMRFFKTSVPMLKA